MGPGELVTVLITDIEASTGRWEHDPASMAVALAAHDVVLDEAIVREGGRRFKHTGDGVCAVFATPLAAVDAAMTAQRRLELPVRMGLHTGAVEVRDGDFFGPTLNRCARIMDAGHGRQVLVSETTASLLAGVELVDLGAFSLRGIERSVRIFQVGAGEFPPLRARRSSNLPSPVSPLIGRDDMVRTVVGLVEQHRLVTLTGVGGVGKTRMALAIALALETEFDSVIFVGLLEVDDDDGVLMALARTLDLPTPTMESVLTALSGRRILLVFDNCEHVLNSVADLVERLLTRSPGCHVLATTREGLALDGEWVVPVPPLSTDGPDATAVALFVERASAQHQGFRLDAATLEVIEEICSRLDGLPLAIELAAARVSVLAPAELRDRLDDRFLLLTGSRRRRSRDRQRTLLETIDWSFDLLDTADQVAFTRLAVFAGSFDVAAAAAVLREGDLGALDVLETLVDRSLLAVEDSPTGRRYRYLETIRAYAEDRLRESDADQDALAALHSHLVTALPVMVQNFRNRMRDEAPRLDREVPNLRRALDWAITRGDADGATRLLRPILNLTGLVVWPIHGWADEAIGLPGVAGSEHEPVLLVVQAVDRWIDYRVQEMRDLLRRAADLDRFPHPVPDDMFSALAILLDVGAQWERLLAAMNERTAADMRTPVDIVTDILVGEREGRAINLDVVSELSAMGDYGRATAAHVHALALASGGPTPAFREARQQASELFVVDSAWWFNTLQTGLAVELLAGNLAEALELADLNLEHAFRIADRSGTIRPLAGYALALRRVDEVEAAAVVRGCLPRRLTLMFKDELAELDDWLAAKLDDDARRALAERGASMDSRTLRDLARAAIEPHLAPAI